MPLLIYHADCADGFTAAYIINSAVAGCVLHPADYGTAPPDVAGQDVIIVDFSYSRDVMMRQIIRDCNSLVLLDHHKTAEAALAGLAAEARDCIFSAHKKIEIVFDMTKCGAHLAWRWAYPEIPVPDFVRYVEDRDLWRKALPGTEEFGLALGLRPMTLEAWDGAFSSHLRLIEEGRGLKQFYDQRVQSLLKSAHKVWLDGHLVHAVNAPYYFASDTGHLLAKRGAFGVVYTVDVDARVRVSLRSEGDFDVSAVAQKFGGGGHRNAAGFTIALDLWAGHVIPPDMESLFQLG